MRRSGRVVVNTIPIPKAFIWITALPAINADWLLVDITPSNTPCVFRVQVAVSIVGSFSVKITRNAVSQTFMLNSAIGDLTAGGLYAFDINIDSGDLVNFIYSATGGTIWMLRVREIDTAVA